MKNFLSAHPNLTRNDENAFPCVFTSIIRYLISVSGVIANVDSSSGQEVRDTLLLSRGPGLYILLLPTECDKSYGYKFCYKRRGVSMKIIPFIFDYFQAIF